MSNSAGGTPQYDHFEIVKAVGLSEEAAGELCDELGNGELGLVEDLTYDGYYYIVRWHTDE